MGFRVYPDSATAPLLVASRTTKDRPIVQLAGAPSPDFPGYAQMMFVRVAMFGGSVAPTFFLSADEGRAVALSPDNVQPLHDGASHYIGDVRLRVEAAYVWQIQVGFDQMSQNEWVLGIRNNDPMSDRAFTWVVADGRSDTLQPWIDVAPGSLRFNAWVGETISDNVTVSNFGTAPFTIIGVTQMPPSSFDVRTPSGAVPPSGTAQITVSFAAPPTPPRPDGITALATTIVTAPTDTTADQHANHNNRLALHAITRYREPLFGAEGGQFDPNKGVVGDPVVLRGNNFDVGTPEVLFGTIKATGVTGVSPSSLKVPVPSGVAFPPGQSSASVKITIRTEGGQDVSGDEFRVLGIPAFDAPGRQFDPNKGVVGDPVVLKGNNFNLGTPEVFFGTIKATAVSNVSSSSLKVSIPAGVIPPGQSSASVKITIRTEGGQDVTDDQFQVSAVPAFAVPGRQFDPNKGVVGDPVVLRGNNFDVGTPEVLFGTIKATGVTGVSPSSLKVPVPSGVAFPPGQSSASVKITIRTEGGQDVSGDEFRVLGIPAFDAPGRQFDPNKGVVGDPVVLKGNNFNLGTPEVFFGTIKATAVSNVSSSSLKVSIPAGVIPPGQSSASVKITIRTEGGQDVTDDQFQVSAVPAFAVPGRQFDPNKGVVGDPVVLRGNNFDVGTPEVLFGTIKATGVTGVSPSSLKVPVPSGVAFPPGQSSASVKITIRTEGGQDVSGDEFRVLGIPAFDAPGRQFDPNKGVVGDPVVLKGNNFNLGTPEVFFGTIKATAVSNVSSSSLKVSIPAGVIPPGQSSASVKITIRTEGGQDVTDDQFQVSAVPAFAGPGGQLKPHIGTNGTPVVLNGTNFNMSGLRVKFGGHLAQPDGEPTGTSLRVLVPTTIAAGTDTKVTVTTSAGEDTSDDIFLVRKEIRRSVRVVTRSGVPVAGVDIARVAANGTYMSGVTDAQGVWAFTDTYFGTVTLMVGRAGWSGAAAKYEPEQWIGEKRVELTSVSRVGSLLILQGTGYVPGLSGRLSPIRESSDRLYIYADNISINDDWRQPAYFEFGRPFKAVNATGTTFMLTVIDMIGRTALIQYEFVSRPATDVGRSVRVVSRLGAPVSGMTVARVAANGTYLEGVTDGQGVWAFRDAYPGKITLMVGGADSSGSSTPYEQGQWVGEKRVTVSSLPNVGSLLILQGTGYVPGLSGRLNPIRDSYDRLYIYADNISINDDRRQPAYFEFGRPFKAVDATGTTFMLTVIDMIGRTALIKYEFVSRSATVVSRTVRVLDGAGASVSGIPVARVAANGTYLEGVTDAEGVWSFTDAFPGDVTVLAGGPGWSGSSRLYASGDWANGGALTVSPVPEGGAVIVPLAGHESSADPLCVKQDYAGRTFIYADNLVINDDPGGPTQVTIGNDFSADDASGNTVVLNIVAIAGQSSLIGYRALPPKEEYEVNR